jgi:hypothetical protein
MVTAQKRKNQARKAPTNVEAVEKVRHHNQKRDETMIKRGNETILNKSPPPLIHEEHLRHDYTPSACSDFIHITGTAIHIALETLIHIAGIRTLAS